MNELLEPESWLQINAEFTITITTTITIHAHKINTILRHIVQFRPTDFSR